MIIPNLKNMDEVPWWSWIFILGEIIVSFIIYDHSKFKKI